MTPNAAIKAIIDTMTGVNYLRASTLTDLNQQTHSFDLTTPIAVHNDLPSVPNLATPTIVRREWPVEVLFLAKDTPDSSSIAEDTIRDTMLALADEFYDRLSVDPIVSRDQPIEEYTTDAIPSRKIGDEVLTGWQLTLTLPITREVYTCP